MVDDLKRFTGPTRAVLSVLLDDPSAEIYGLHIAVATGLKSGSLYPILNRLERAGWLVARWEDIDPAAEKRPRRRYYRLTGEGVSRARAALTEHRASAGRWGWVG